MFEQRRGQHADVRWHGRREEAAGQVSPQQHHDQPQVDLNELWNVATYMQGVDMYITMEIHIQFGGS